MDSPSTVASSSVGPSPVSPLKREHSSSAVDDPAIASASKRLRDVLSGGPAADDDKEKEKEKEDSKKDSVSSKVEAQVTCGVCQDILYHPVATLPCLHVHCGSCATTWFEKNHSCPSCRTQATGFSDSHATNALLDMYFGLGNVEERTASEKEALEKVYKPGQKIVLGGGAGEYDYGDDEEEVYSDEEEEEEPEPEETEEERLRREFHWPCPCCVAPNDYGHACENPISLPDDPANEATRLASNLVATGHETCINCRVLLPNTPQFGSSCSLCRVFVCNEVTDPCNPTVKIVCLRDLDAPNGSIRQTLPRSFAGLAAEQTILDQYLIAASITLSQLFSTVFPRDDERLEVNRPAWLGPSFDEDEPITLDTEVCDKCALACFETALLEYWTAKKEEPEVVALLPASVQARTDCWYGLYCRTAPHNASHATRLNHLCPPTRFPPALGPAPPAGHRVISHPYSPPPPFSDSSLTFRDIGGTPIVLASANVSGQKLPGKLQIPSRTSAPAFFAPFDGHELALYTTVEVLWETEEMEWIKARDGIVPDGTKPVIGGHELDGQEIYHAACWKDGVRVPGKTSVAQGAASISWGAREWIFKEYELLCWK